MSIWGAGLVGLWLVSLPVLTHVRAYDWQDERTLWRGAAHLAPLKPRPALNLGVLSHREGAWWTAGMYYRHGYDLALAPGRPSHERRVGCLVAAENLARLDRQRGVFDGVRLACD